MIDSITQYLYLYITQRSSSSFCPLTVTLLLVSVIYTSTLELGVKYMFGEGHPMTLVPSRCSAGGSAPNTVSNGSGRRLQLMMEAEQPGQRGGSLRSLENSRQLWKIMQETILEVDKTVTDHIKFTVEFRRFGLRAVEVSGVRELLFFIMVFLSWLTAETERYQWHVCGV